MAQLVVQKFGFVGKIESIHKDRQSPNPHRPDFIIAVQLLLIEDLTKYFRITRKERSRRKLWQKDQVVRWLPVLGAYHSRRDPY